MIKTFKVWVENQLEKRRLMRILIDRLGYDRDALENDVIITDRKLSDILNSIEALPIGEKNKQDMINFAKSNNKSLSLKALANKINPVEVEIQDKISSSPAVLPPGNQPAPKPINRQQIMQQQQPGMQ